MDIIIAIALALLIVLGLVVIVLLVRRSTGQSEQVKASLREEFLNFQTSVHQELNTTRSSLESAKDVISNQTVQTINQIKDVGGTLNKLIQQQEEAQRLGQSLKDLLQAPKLRGNYAETVLEDMLERVLPRGAWERQYRIDGSEMVDCIVRFRDVIVPIDAKFPRDDYVRYSDAEDPDQKQAHWKGFQRSVKTQIDSIDNKYVKPGKGTSEFALMFIPSEAIYYETIADTNHVGVRSDLFEYAQAHHVFPVSPNTLYPFLQVIVLAIRNVEIIDSAKQLQKALSGLESSFEYFYRKHEEIGKNLSKASEAYRIGDGHIQRYRTKLEGALKLEGLNPSESQPALSDKIMTADSPSKAGVTEGPAEERDENR